MNLLGKVFFFDFLLSWRESNKKWCLANRRRAFLSVLKNCRGKKVTQLLVRKMTAKCCWIGRLLRRFR
jgi:hypothetical protein